MNLYWWWKRRNTLKDERKKIIVLGDKDPTEGETRLVKGFILRLISPIDEFRWIRSWENFYPLFHDGFLNIMKSYNYSYSHGERKEFYATTNQELFKKLREADAPDLHDDLVLIPPPEFWTILCYDLADVLFPEWSQKKLGEGVSVDYLRNYKLARKVITLSKSLKRELIRFGVDHKKITVLPFDFGEPVRKPLIPLPKNYLLVPVYAEERDNIQNIKAALNAVKDSLRIKTVFLNLSMNKDAKLDLDGFRVVTPGSLSEVEGWFYRARAVLYIPSYDGWGWPAIAAIRYGKPLISAGNSALLEVAPGYAEYVREDEVEHIVHVLRRVWNNEYKINNEVRDELMRTYTTEFARNTLKRVVEETLRKSEDGQKGTH